MTFGIVFVTLLKALCKLGVPLCCVLGREGKAVCMTVYRVWHIAVDQFLLMNEQGEPQWLAATGHLLHARHHPKTSSKINPT